MYVYTTLHTKFQGNWFSSFKDTRFWNYSYSSSLHQFKRITLSKEKQTSHISISFKLGTPIRHIVAYLSLKFGDVQAAFVGVINVQNL